MLHCCAPCSNQSISPASQATTADVAHAGTDARQMVWHGMVNVDFDSTIITKVSNVLNTLVSGEKPGFEALSRGGHPARSTRPWGHAQRMLGIQQWIADVVASPSVALWLT